MSRPVLILIIAVAGALAAPAPAAAERAALFVGGSARDVDRATLSALARAQAEAAGWTVLEPPLGAVPLGDLITCVADGLGKDCVPGHLDDADVDRGIVLSISAEPVKGKGKKARAEPTYAVSGWVFQRNGDLLFTDRRACERCKAPELEAAVRDLTDALVREARARARPTVLLTRSSPAGAQVFVDDVLVGNGEVELPVFAGVHRIRFQLDGYHEEVREIAIGDGESLTVDVTLRKLPAAEQPEPVVTPAPDKPFRLVPWLVIGGGGALLVTGAVLFALDEDPIQDGGRVLEYTDTVMPAIGLAVAGAAITSLGVYLLLRGGDEPTAEQRATPVVSVAPGTAWLGVRGRF